MRCQARRGTSLSQAGGGNNEATTVLEDKYVRKSEVLSGKPSEEGRGSAAWADAEFEDDDTAMIAPNDDREELEFEDANARASDARFTTPERNPPTRRYSGEADREDPSKARRVEAGNVEMKNDVADGMNLDSMQVDALELNVVDQLIIGKAIQGSDVLELYSPVRVNAVAAKFGLVPGMSLDLTNGYDFDDKRDQDKAWEVIRKTNLHS